jgi:hypothetical protein
MTNYQGSLAFHAVSVSETRPGFLVFSTLKPGSMRLVGRYEEDAFCLTQGKFAKTGGLSNDKLIRIDNRWPEQRGADHTQSGIVGPGNLYASGSSTNQKVDEEVDTLACGIHLPDIIRQKYAIVGKEPARISPYCTIGSKSE